MRETDAADDLTAGLNSLHIAQYRGISPPPAEPPKAFASLDADAVELIVRLLPSCYDVARVAGANRALRDAARVAAVARIAATPVPLPSDAPSHGPALLRLRAVHWAEAVAARRPHALGAGNRHSVALRAPGDSRPACSYEWGTKAPRSDAVGVLHPVSVTPDGGFGGAGATAVEVSAGDVHVLLLDSNGDVWTWGYDGRSGRLGHGASTTHVVARPEKIELPSDSCTRPGVPPTVLQVAAGGVHSLFLDARGRVLACGDNCHSQLGFGDTGPDTSRRLATALHSGLFGSNVALGGRRVVQIAAGGTHSAAVCEAGAVWTWGDGACGKLGHGTRDERRYARPHRVERFVAMKVRVREVSAGGRHTLAVTTKSELFGWGSNAVGQLGLGSDVVGLGNGTPGSNLPIQIDVGNAQTTVQSASAGEEHSLVLTDNGEVYAMGDNRNGVLGLGSRAPMTPIFEPTSVTFFTPVTELAAGGKHSLARDRKGKTHSWGCGDGGALGSGDTDDSDIVLPILNLAPIPAEFLPSG